MADSPSPVLLDVLEAQQDDVLEQLDDLNEQIERTLREAQVSVHDPPAATS